MSHLMLKGNWLCLSSVVCKGGDQETSGVCVSTHCQKRLRTSLKYSLCDLKAIPPTSALTHQFIKKPIVVNLPGSCWRKPNKKMNLAPSNCIINTAYCMIVLHLVHTWPQNATLRDDSTGTSSSCGNRWSATPSPRDDTEQRGNRCRTPIKSCHWTQPVCLCVPLCCCYCDIKQTGDLHYSSGQRGHRERGCHGNGPLHGCQNCLIIHDHHHRASAGNQLEPLNRLNGEIKKLYHVAIFGESR